MPKCKDCGRETDKREYCFDCYKLMVESRCMKMKSKNMEAGY